MRHRSIIAIFSSLSVLIFGYFAYRIFDFIMAVKMWSSLSSDHEKVSLTLPVFLLIFCCILVIIGFIGLYRSIRINKTIVNN